MDFKVGSLTRTNQQITAGTVAMGNPAKEVLYGKQVYVDLAKKNIDHPMKRTD